MSNWLSEAEKETATRKPQGRSAGFLDRKMRVQKNYEKNKDAYEAFISQLNELVNRANSLPLEKKHPYGHIDLKFKETKLHNQFHSYRSSRRYERKLVRKFWERLFRFSVINLFRPSHFKHIRVLYVTVSSKKNQVGFEIREAAQLRQRVVVDADLVKQRKYKDPNRYHAYFNWDMDQLNEDLAMKILDWLAFKTDLNELPFTSKLK